VVVFELQVDAVFSALNSIGFKNVEIVVAETGWPYKGDDNEIGPSIENAKAYNGNLIAHLRSMVGTPLMPGKSVDTYLFALYDEDLKPGPGSERSFGLFKPDLTMAYDVGLSKSSQVIKSQILLYFNNIIIQLHAFIDSTILFVKKNGQFPFKVYELVHACGSANLQFSWCILSLIQWNEGGCTVAIFSMFCI